MGLAASIATSALLKQTTLPLLTKGTLLLMTTSKTKLALAAVAAILVLLLSNGTTALVTYQIARHQNAKVTIAANDSSEPGLAFSTDGERTEPVHVRRRELVGTVRIVNNDDGVVTTNEVDQVVVVEGDQTNRVSITPGGRPRRVMSYRAGTGAGGPGGAGGIGGGAAPDSYGAGTGVPETPAFETRKR
jgi:hypothetical protein